MKKFFKKTEGFTLVELIVVIAILGILAGVGTVGYSGYIKKANMAADQQLASGVASVLQLEYYSDMDTTGYVILSKGKAPSVAEKTISSEKIAEALKTAYGDLGALELKSDEWAISNEMLEAALNAGAVSDSSYVKNSSVSELLGNVQTITGAAYEVLGNKARGEQHMLNLLKLNLGDEYLQKAVENNIIEEDSTTTTGYKLKAGTYTSEGSGVKLSQDLQNQLANMMVFGVAQDMKEIETPDMTALMLSGVLGSVPTQYENQPALVLASQYAFYKSYAVDCGAEASFNELNNAIAAAGQQDDALDVVEAALATFVADNAEGIEKYATNSTGDGFSDTVLNNAAAIPQIMTGVSAVEGNYKSSLSDGNLYTSGGVAADLTNYINVAGMAANLTPEQKAALGSAEGGMIITVGPNGVSNPSLS